MLFARSTLAALVLLPLPRPAQPSGAPTLDFEFYKARIEPILTTKRPGNARCVACHGFGTTMRLQPLPEGSATWNEADARANFEILKSRVVPGDPDASRLLRHPLAEDAGGDPHHDGGKHWTSKSDPEYQTLAAWVNGATLQSAAKPAPARADHPDQRGRRRRAHHRSATNKVVGHITGIEVGHGAAATPDGRWIYVSNEAESTLDVVDAQTLLVTSKVPLSGHPNNISSSRDGKRVYVAIRQEPGLVDVIDTATVQRVKSIPIKGAVHNTYVTPDGRYVIAGSIAGKTLTAIDQKTEEIAWVKEFELGVRPMAFEQNADGSTKRIFVQLSEFNGFAVVDFATQKEITRIENPKIAAGEARARGRQRVARDDGFRRQLASRRVQPLEQRGVRVLAAGSQAPGRSTSALLPTGSR